MWFLAKFGEELWSIARLADLLVTLTALGMSWLSWRVQRWRRYERWRVEVWEGERCLSERRVGPERAKLMLSDEIECIVVLKGRVQDVGRWLNDDLLSEESLAKGLLEIDHDLRAWRIDLAKDSGGGRRPR